MCDRLQSQFGVTDTALDWLHSYLCDRTGYVKIGQRQSDTVQLDVGVPQGSVLGPLLFAVADVITQHGVKFHQYVDDTQLQLAMHADNTADGLAVLAACTADVRQWYLQNGRSILISLRLLSSGHPVSCKSPRPTCRPYPSPVLIYR